MPLNTPGVCEFYGKVSLTHDLGLGCSDIKRNVAISMVMSADFKTSNKSTIKVGNECVLVGHDKTMLDVSKDKGLFQNDDKTFILYRNNDQVKKMTVSARRA